MELYATTYASGSSMYSFEECKLLLEGSKVIINISRFAAVGGFKVSYMHCGNVQSSFGTISTLPSQTLHQVYRPRLISDPLTQEGNMLPLHFFISVKWAYSQALF